MIRVLTVGTGTITTGFCRAVDVVPGIRVHAVHSRDAGRATRLADSVGAVPAPIDLERALTLEDIDAVYVASPNRLHAEHVRLAIERGKHVLVEKPGVTDAPAWADLVAQADRAGVVLMEAVRSAYDPGTLELERLLPLAGRLRRASFRFEKVSSRYPAVLRGESSSAFDPDGGGALLDLGVYAVNTVIGLFGEPRGVAGLRVAVAGGVDGAGIALLDYGDVVVDVSVSKITTSFASSTIQGEDATLEIDRVVAPRSITVRPVDGAAPTVHEIPPPAHLLAPEVARFVDLVRGADPGPDQRRTGATLRTLDRIRAAWTDDPDRA